MNNETKTLIGTVQTRAFSQVLALIQPTETLDPFTRHSASYTFDRTSLTYTVSLYHITINPISKELQ